MKSVKKLQNVSITDILLFLFPSIVIISIYSIRVYNCLISPFPKKLRECNTIIFAELFSKGINPYSRSALESSIPMVTSMYGITVPMIMSPFVFLFSKIGFHSIQICEILTLIIELLGLFFTYKTIMIKTRSVFLSLFGSLMIIGCYWRMSANAGAFPDQWGLFGCILLMFLVANDLDQNTYHPFVYSILLILLAYTKQYFAFVIPGLLLFLFVNNYKAFFKTFAFYYINN